MECSICYNEITSATGKVELSCLHSFHFSCLTTWFDKQKVQGACENCPLCRHEANEFEKMPGSSVEEEEDEDEDEDEDEEEDEEENEAWEQEPTIEELAAQERARQRFDKYILFNPIEEVQLYSANLIKACWRGYQDRLLYTDYRANKYDIKFYEAVVKRNQKALENSHSRNKFIKSIAGLSRIQVKNMAAMKMQALWRGSKVRSITPV